VSIGGIGNTGRFAPVWVSGEMTVKVAAKKILTWSTAQRVSMWATRCKQVWWFLTRNSVQGKIDEKDIPAMQTF